MVAKNCSAAPSQSGRGKTHGFMSRAIIRILTAALRNLKYGKLDIVLPSGLKATVFEGQAVDGCDVVLHMKNFGAFWKSLRRGTIGFAASYLDGDFEVNNLANAFRFFVKNKGQLGGAGQGLFNTRLPDKLFHRARANTKRGSRRNIAAHYDLGNAFYAEWLDETMTYSSALFDGDKPLEQAQGTKYRRIAELIGVAPGKSVLEIGCGWGGMSELAARQGANVTALTVSREQLHYAKERMSNAGLAGKVDVRFEDYRDCRGTFDAIASIEMIEAVGEENWSTYFNTLAARLKTGGRAAIQAITIEPELFKSYRKKPDFIQRFIFPGGMLLTEQTLDEHAQAAGLEVLEKERFGLCYARTLKEWRTRFLDAWPRLEGMGFDQRIRRMWLYYLTYCEVGFEQGTINVGIYVFRKPAAALSSSTLSS